MGVEENRIRKFIVHDIMKKMDDSVLDFEDSLLKKGIIDSWALLNLATFLESEFRVALCRTDMVQKNFETIHSIAKLIRVKNVSQH